MVALLYAYCCFAPVQKKNTEKVGEVIAMSDYILVAAALTPETKGMVGAKELARVLSLIHI